MDGVTGLFPGEIFILTSLFHQIIFFHSRRELRRAMRLKPVKVLQFFSQIRVKYSSVIKHSATATCAVALILIKLLFNAFIQCIL